MKTLLVGINAKYIHSNLAIRYLKKYTESQLNVKIDISEYTVNHQLDFILREIAKQKPDVLGFSCYIWNFEYIKKLTRELKKIMPDTTIILGGPEVSFDARQSLETTGCDAVISGEGEAVFCELIDRLVKQQDYSDLKGLTVHNNGQVTSNEPASRIGLDEIPFVYDDYNELENRIVYYEASRGCPFQCQYCLSGAGGGVAFLSLERVYSDLRHFLNAKVHQVKFVDRTFNSDKKYAMAIWRFLSEHDNGITNFHFEIAAELLDADMIAFLQTVRRGLFQLEIGVQSTNIKTLQAIKRTFHSQKLAEIITQLQKNQNIHLHLDLIAGLPFEDYTSFAKSFDYVYQLKPNQLQLGFLKLLKGSGLYEKASEYQLIYTSYAPYEVLQTGWLCYEEIAKLKMIEDMVETYYNSNRYQLTIRYLCEFFDSPFAMFEAMAEYYEKNNLHTAPHSKVGYYTVLWDFFKSQLCGDESRFKWLALYDCYSHEKAKKLPEWLDCSVTKHYKNTFFDFVDKKENVIKYLAEYEGMETKQILRSAHIEVFPFHPFDNQPQQTAILFNYRNCDILGNATIEMITL